MNPSPCRVAICGAGIAGLACALRLQQSGYAVTLYDKSRGPGGRCATRRSDVGTFDHGVPQFSARTDAFRAEVFRWQREGWVTPALEKEQWIGVPSMSTLTRRLAEPLSLVASTPIAVVERRDEGWLLRASDPAGASADQLYDVVVIAVPAEQAMPLLAANPTLREQLRGVHSDPCWAVMAAWDAPLGLPAARLIPDEGPLAAAWRDDAKPRRTVVDGTAERWVLHGRADWTQRHLEVDSAVAGAALLAAFDQAAGACLPKPIHCVTHRWRYAQVCEPTRERFGWDAQAHIGSCGDAWWGSGESKLLDGMERAWLSGNALAEAIVSGNLPGKA